jgi:hypothetical protein
VVECASRRVPSQNSLVICSRGCELVPDQLRYLSKAASQGHTICCWNAIAPNIEDRAPPARFHAVQHAAHPRKILYLPISAAQRHSVHDNLPYWCGRHPFLTPLPKAPGESLNYFGLETANVDHVRRAHCLCGGVLLHVDEDMQDHSLVMLEDRGRAPLSLSCFVSQLSLFDRNRDLVGRRGIGFAASVAGRGRAYGPGDGRGDSQG